MKLQTNLDGSFEEYGSRDLSREEDRTYDEIVTVITDNWKESEECTVTEIQNHLTKKGYTVGRIQLEYEDDKHHLVVVTDSDEKVLFAVTVDASDDYSE